LHRKSRPIKSMDWAMQKLGAKSRRMTAIGAPLPPEDLPVAAASWGSADPLERSTRDAG
jgi:hypothetical protein